MVSEEQARAAKEEIMALVVRFDLLIVTTDDGPGTDWYVVYYTQPKSPAKVSMPTEVDGVRIHFGGLRSARIVAHKE